MRGALVIGYSSEETTRPHIQALFSKTGNDMQRDECEGGKAMKVLCAIDGSQLSLWGVDALGSLFHPSITDVILLHVIDTTPLKAPIRRGKAVAEPTKKVMKAMESGAKSILKISKNRLNTALSQSVTKPFVDIHPVLARGHAASTIIREVEKQQPDVVIIGSRGLQDITGYLVGSVSRKVLSYAPSAVLTVKEPIPVPVHAVLAVDGSNASKRAANALGVWMAPEVMTLHVLSVVPSMLTDIAPKVLPKKHLKALMEPFEQRAQEVARSFRQVFLKDGFKVTAEVLQGNPREVILHCLQKRKADLVVLGSKGLTGSERFQMGSVSEWVTAYAPCSSLVARPH